MGVLMFPGTGGLRSAMALSMARGTAVQPQERLGRAWQLLVREKYSFVVLLFANWEIRDSNKKQGVWKLYKYVITKE